MAVKVKTSAGKITKPMTNASTVANKNKAKTTTKSKTKSKKKYGWDKYIS